MVLYYKDESGSGAGPQGPAGAQGAQGAQGAIGPQGPQGASSGGTACGEGFLFAQTTSGAVLYVPTLAWTVPFATSPAPVELDAPGEFTWANDAFTATAGLWQLDADVNVSAISNVLSSFTLKLVNAANTTLWEETVTGGYMSGQSPVTAKMAIHLKGIAIGGVADYNGIRVVVDVSSAGPNNMARVLKATFSAVRVCPVTST